MRPAKLMTAEELEKLDMPNKQVELVRGRLFVREPPGAWHGNVAMNIAFEIKKHADANNLGEVFAAETGFKLFSNPDTVRAPDVAFVRRERVEAGIPDGFFARSPDLAVEVLSPGDRRDKVLAKVADWLAAGSALVWIVDPRRRTARVYRADGTESEITSEGALDGEGVLPGFVCPLARVMSR